MSKKTPAPSDTADKFMLRFPEGMRDQIREAAEKNNRSMNAEIVSRLEASFGMDVPLVQGTVNAVQGFKAVAKQLTTLVQNPQFQAFIESFEQNRSKEIEHSAKNDEKPTPPTKDDK